MHCHAGCSTDRVCEALGMRVGELFDEPRTNGKGRRIAATYDYTDETGELLYQTVRYEPKDFRQRRPNGHGGWLWKLGDVRRVLYRLLELIDAVKRGVDVFVVEGEKDADAIVREGETATCSPMGAGKWRDEFAGHFRGANRVVIVAHDDLPGYRHARDVAESLASVVDEVTVCRPAFGNDAADHLGGGLPLEDLVVIEPEELDELCDNGSPSLPNVEALMADTERTQPSPMLAPPAPGEYQRRGDQFNAEVFYGMHAGKVLYSPQLSRWLVWNERVVGAR